MYNHEALCFRYNKSTPPADHLRLMVFLRPEKKKAHFDTPQATSKTAVLFCTYV
jgi:hypothetical protein